MTIYLAFNFYGTGTVEVGFVDWDLPNDMITQFMNGAELTGADHVLLTWLLEFVEGTTL